MYKNSYHKLMDFPCFLLFFSDIKFVGTISTKKKNTYLFLFINFSETSVGHKELCHIYLGSFIKEQNLEKGTLPVALESKIANISLMVCCDAEGK